MIEPQVEHGGASSWFCIAANAARPGAGLAGAAPCSADSVYWEEVYVYRRGRFRTARCEHRAFYLARLAEAEAQLARARPGVADGFDAQLASYLSRVYAEKAWRLRRLLAGHEPFGD